MLDVWQGEQTNLMIDLACWPCCNSPYFILEEFLVKCSSSDLVHTHSHSRFPSSLARFNLRRLGRSPTGSENREPRKILWFIIIWKMTTFLGVNPHSVCSSGWYRSHRENHDVCPRKVEKFTCQEISARKVEKIEKFEKSKSRKIRTIRKIRKVENFLAFWLFAKMFPGRVINPVGFWRHWSTGSIHAQGFLWLFGCSFPVEWLVTFQGSRKLAISVSVSGLDFVLLM